MCLREVTNAIVASFFLSAIYFSFLDHLDSQFITFVQGSVIRREILVGAEEIPVDYCGVCKLPLWRRRWRCTHSSGTWSGVTECLGPDDSIPQIWRWQLRSSSYNSNKLTNQMQQFYKYITWRFVSLNMFRAPPRPSSGAYNCINLLKPTGYFTYYQV